MQYKTIVLQFLEQCPEIHNRLRNERMLLEAVNFYARGLKASHEAQKILLGHAKPDSDPSQIASEALEIALKDLEGSLLIESPVSESGLLSLEGVMAVTRRHTPDA